MKFHKSSSSSTIARALGGWSRWSNRSQCDCGVPSLANVCDKGNLIIAPASTGQQILLVFGINNKKKIYGRTEDGYALALRTTIEWNPNNRMSHFVEISLPRKQIRSRNEVNAKPRCAFHFVRWTLKLILFNTGKSSSSRIKNGKWQMAIPGTNAYHFPDTRNYCYYLNVLHTFTDTSTHETRSGYTLRTCQSELSSTVLVLLHANAIIASVRFQIIQM